MPIFNVSMTLTLFYAVAPFVVFSMHFYVVLQLSHVVHLATSFHGKLHKIAQKELRQDQRDLLFPFLPLMILLNGAKRPWFRFGAEILTISSVGFLPPVVLFLCQAKFVPYHAYYITKIHQGLVGADLLLVGIAGIWGLLKLGNFSQLDLGQKKWVRMFDGVFIGYAVFFIVIIAYCSWFLAVIPAPTLPDDGYIFADTPSSRKLYKEIRWNFDAAFNRDIELPDDFSFPEVAKTSTAKVDLTDRNLAGLRATRPDFSGARLHNTDLRGALLFKANFAGALLDRVDLRGALMMRSSFIGASLIQMRAGGAYLNEADFSGASIEISYLEFASLGNATLSGAYLSHNDFTGANFNEAKLTGLIISGDFSGASFRNAELAGMIPGFQSINPRQKRAKPPIAWDQMIMGARAGSFSASDFTGATVGNVDLQRFDHRDIEGRPSAMTTTAMQRARTGASASLQDLADDTSRESAKSRIELALGQLDDLAAANSIFKDSDQDAAGNTKAAAVILLNKACREEWLGQGFARVASEQKLPLSDRWRGLLAEALLRNCDPLIHQRKNFTDLIARDKDSAAPH